jgi:superfamily II DNA or RNA helicase
MYQNWINSRGLRTLNYQENAVTKVNNSLEEQEITVLAACPSAGKTIMTILIMDEYLKQNPNHKVMVLTHGTTVLRTQFYDVLKEVKPDFSYNLVEKISQYDPSVGANICLPQTIAGYKLNKIDLLIVDEAHQFYYGEKLIKDIIKQTHPKKQLLLTGSPSPFIAKNLPIIPITLNTIYDEGMVSDLYVEIATSSYQFDFTDDYNQDDELKSTVHFKDSDTKKTLDDLVEKIVNRLKSIKGNDLINFTGWLPTLKHLQKTMIACKSIQQANQVEHYFNKIGVNCLKSTSDTDVDSNNIQQFKDDKNCLVLIVVGRGILGFNYSELVNVVDMTVSKNIDRVYQLLCRVIRIHPKGEKKLFIKVAPNIHSDYFKYFMTAVLSMSEAEFFTKYNGKNFNDMVIPVIKTDNKRIKNSDDKISDNNNSNKPKNKFKSVIFEGLPVFSFFKDLYHKKDDILHIYARTTMRDVRAEFMKTMPNGYWTKEKCIESAKNFEKLSDWFKNEYNAYDAAYRNGWLNECCENLIVNNNRGYWTKEKCIESAKKYQTQQEWIKNEETAYQVARRHNWLDICESHMIKRNIWSKEKCIESAKKYQTKGEWIKYDKKAYQAARHNNWLDDCYFHLSNKIKSSGYWTKEKCLKEAKKYKLRNDFKNYSGGAYQAARKNGWLDEICQHMKRPNKNS